MFGELTRLVDLIRSLISDLRKNHSENERNEAILELLKVYFLFKDCVDEGEALVLEAGSDPVSKIKLMNAEEALLTMERWDAIIRRQGFRLHSLQGYLLGQHHLTVINPELQEKIRAVIGSKMERAVSLHGIGAALFFKNMFPIANSNEEKAKYIAIMAGEENDSLNIPRINLEINKLRESLEQYRAILLTLTSSEEILRLSAKARLET